MLIYQFAHHFNRTFEIKAFARTHVQLEGNGVNACVTPRKAIILPKSSP